MREFRRDPIIGRWIIISTERAKRPFAILKYKREIDDLKHARFAGVTKSLHRLKLSLTDRQILKKIRPAGK